MINNLNHSNSPDVQPYPIDPPDSDVVDEDEAIDRKLRAENGD